MRSERVSMQLKGQCKYCSEGKGREGFESTEIFELSEVNGELDQVAPPSSQVSQGLNFAVVNVDMLEFGECVGII
jgi:hypothetical protein